MWVDRTGISGIVVKNSYRTGAAVKKFPTIVPVVAAALIGLDGRVLMQRRRRDAEHGGLWEFPGGKVEPGESLEESLCREIREELGIAIVAEALNPLSFAAAPDQPYVILLYTCRNWSGTPVCLDGEEIGWFAPDQVQSLPMPPLDVPLARALLEMMKRAI
ncbi:MAG: (deoxy)nucleoside triphosphate pyrophosphohydrolase [Novosphingobium sp.]